MPKGAKGFRPGPNARRFSATGRRTSTENSIGDWIIIGYLLFSGIKKIEQESEGIENRSIE